jgi:hypothetical protein
VPRNDFLTNSQADASAGKFVSFVQALEHTENFIEILRINTNAVVLNGKQPFSLAGFRGR